MQKSTKQLTGVIRRPLKTAFCSIHGTLAYEKCEKYCKVLGILCENLAKKCKTGRMTGGCRYKTVFENRDFAIETVTPMLDKGEWKVSGYYIK